ncbi:hypothetical protein M433DRAFT_498023 [Acidomyces richmondensis BFW]|nr:MAG: hypothetical protein FE78DRAFT_308216 [Acidomyces sp. 'richmondensis']KYG41129.1 hypothetical protein M433DRAFT_498023 [Acidomyces richmondensis BFW]
MQGLMRSGPVSGIPQLIMAVDADETCGDIAHSNTSSVLPMVGPAVRRTTCFLRGQRCGLRHRLSSATVEACMLDRRRGEPPYASGTLLPLFSDSRRRSCGRGRYSGHGKWDFQMRQVEGWPASRRVRPFNPPRGLQWHMCNTCSGNIESELGRPKTWRRPLRSCITIHVAIVRTADRLAACVVAHTTVLYCKC